MDDADILACAVASLDLEALRLSPSCAPQQICPIFLADATEQAYMGLVGALALPERRADAWRTHWARRQTSRTGMRPRRLATSRSWTRYRLPRTHRSCPGRPRASKTRLFGCIRRRRRSQLHRVRRERLRHVQHLRCHRREHSLALAWERTHRHMYRRRSAPARTRRSRCDIRARCLGAPCAGVLLPKPTARPPGQDTQARDCAHPLAPQRVQTKAADARITQNTGPAPSGLRRRA
jgi:hypothetical protein